MNKTKIKPDRDLVEIFLIIIVLMFILVASMSVSAYALESFSLELSDSCKYLDCFDLCDLSIFDNSTASYSGAINYNDGCSRSPPGDIPFTVLFSMYGYSSIIELNAIDQEHKDKTTISIFPNLEIMVASIRNEGGLIHQHYNQTTIDRNCDLIKVTNDFNIIVNVLNYAMSNCQDRNYYEGLGNFEIILEPIEKKVRYPSSSKAFLNNCLAGQDPRFDIIDCYSEFLKHNN